MKLIVGSIFMITLSIFFLGLTFSIVKIVKIKEREQRVTEEIEFAKLNSMPRIAKSYAETLGILKDNSKISKLCSDNIIKLLIKDTETALENERNQNGYDENGQ